MSLNPILCSMPPSLSHTDSGKVGQIPSWILLMWQFIFVIPYIIDILFPNIIIPVQVRVKPPRVQNMHIIIRGKDSSQHWFVPIHLELVLLIS
jgi:hypothetical protein